jgi:5-methylcytosine-specific restriction protein B
METQLTQQDGIGQLFCRVLDRYGNARHHDAFSGKHEVHQLFEALRERIEASPAVQAAPSISVVSSYGKGNWATIPWVSLLDARETTTTQRDTYIVYLFREDGKGVWVKIGQGVTDVQNQFKGKAREVLAARSERLRAHVAALADEGFDLSGKSDLGTNHSKARMYEASTIASKFYPREAMPSDAEILSDLEKLIGAYETIIERRAEVESHDKRIALVGTWGSVRADLDRVAAFIKDRGAWASPWSFPIKRLAANQLRTPFAFFVNAGGGQIVARAVVTAVAEAPDAGGMESPWPDITEERFLGMSRFGSGVHDGIKTWLKFTEITPVTPFRANQLMPVEGLSSPASVLNQMTFGYVWDDVSIAVEEERVPGDDVVPDEEAEPLDFDWLLRETLLPREQLEAMVAALSSSGPQVLLVGPPGTSKTWVAQRIARFLTSGRPGAVRTVQFHPSYTYESFIEGLRPRASTAGVQFELTPGVVVDVVNSMREKGQLNDPSRPFAIIIDEANRANLPRVLGELLFLFEYRNEAIALQYTKEFRLPSNLMFIGTMNTADRSIRSVDAALRRRFEVFELAPNSDALRTFFAETDQQGGDQLAAGLDALNAALSHDIDRHHTIGHSFLMKRDMSPRRLRDIWNRQVFPLIEEYFFDQPDLASSYTIERFWPTYGA